MVVFSIDPESAIFEIGEAGSVLGFAVVFGLILDLLFSGTTKPSMLLRVGRRRGLLLSINSINFIMDKLYAAEYFMGESVKHIFLRSPFIYLSKLVIYGYAGWWV